ncbi:MAG: pitrilysin family protein [Pseudomonadota bacterium]
MASLLGALLLVSSAVAVETPPPGGEPRPFELPDHETLKLDNGLDVTLIPFGRVPKVSVVIAVAAGNLHEGEQTWLADITGDLMQEGAGGKSAAAVAETFADMGGALGIGVGMERTSISASGLAEFAPAMVRELAAVVMSPNLPDDQLARIRADRLRQLSVSRTQPRTQASAAFNALLYGDHAYGRVLPTDEQLNSITMDDVREFYGSNFGALRTRVYIAGLFDRDAVVDALQSTLGTWKPGLPPSRDIPAMASGPVVKLIDRPDAPQSTVYLGLASPDPSQDDFLAFSVMNTLLGGNLSSRLSVNLRENKGYTYSARSNVSTNYRASFWRFNSDVTSENTGDAIREALFEVRRLQDEPPSDAELTGTKNYLAGNFVMGNATRGGLIGQLAYLDYHELPLERLTQFVQSVHEVDPDTISELARRYLRPEKMVLVVVGDIDLVREQLKEISEFQEFVAD